MAPQGELGGDPAVAGLHVARCLRLLSHASSFTLPSREVTTLQLRHERSPGSELRWWHFQLVDVGKP